MLDSDQPAADGGGERDGDVGGSGAAGGAPPPSLGVEAEADDSSDSFGWTSSEDDDDHLADDAADAPAGVGGVVPFALADPRRLLSPAAAGAPTFGNVAVANSTDVQFGNKTFFNGPVTIKQVVYAKDVEGAAATAVPAAGSGASVAHVDPAAPDKAAVVAGDVRLKVLPPVIVANGVKPAHANGVIPNTSNGSVASSHSCEIPSVSGSEKPGSAAGGRCSWWRRLWKTTRERNVALCTAAAVLVLVGGIMSVLSALLKDPGRAAAGAGAGQLELPKPWETTETNVTLSGKLKIIPRRLWLAQPRLDPPSYLHPPVPYVIISHSASEGCNTQASCTQMVRFIQTFHIESRGWSDIGYNFLVGGDGYVYEGRGWTVVGAHTFGYNNRSLGFNMVGTFITELPSEAQMLALRQLIEMGVGEGYIAEDYKLLAHRQLSATESPGTRLYEELKTWDHWSPTP